MQGSDFHRFRSVMAGMAEMYQRDLSGTLLDAYWLAFRAWSLSEFEAAAAHLMAASTFMPRPSDFNALRKAAGETPAEAFQRVLAGCSRWRHGERGDGDPATNAALLAIGGNEALALCDRDKLHWLEKRFCEVLEEQRDVNSTRQALGLPDPTSAPRLGSTMSRLVPIGEPRGGASARRQE